MEILTISLGRNILRRDARERERMRSYAVHLTSFHIVVLTRTEHGYSDTQHEGTLHIYPTNSTSRVMMLWDAFCITRKIGKQSRENPLIISAQDPLEIGWLCALLSFVVKARLHIQVHGDYFSSNAWVGYSLIRRFRRMYALLLLRRAPAIRVVSERIKESLIARDIPASKITVLPIRPELESFLSKEHIFRDAFPYTFLFIGRLAPEKDISRILGAFAMVHTEYSDTQLRIVGEGEERANIIARIKEKHLEDVVTVLPWTEDVPNEMVHADICLLASKHEAYALTLIESLAVGVPVVTTDVGCVGELVQDGVHGIVVKEAGVTPYADAMKRMIEDSSFRKTAGEAGKKLGETLTQQSADAYAVAWVRGMTL